MAGVNFILDYVELYKGPENTYNNVMLIIYLTANLSAALEVTSPRIRLLYAITDFYEINCNNNPIFKKQCKEIESRVKKTQVFDGKL